jgi:HAE1 family hydrophobic/amphiphilic exporter-1
MKGNGRGMQVVTIVMALTAPMAAQDADTVAQDAGTVTQLAAPPRIGVDIEPPETLTLDAVIRTALEHNQDVAIAKLQLDASRQDVRAAEGAYDPHLSPTLFYQRATTPTVSSIGGSATGSLAQREVSGDLQLSGLTPWLGSQFSVNFGASRLATNNQFARVNPQFPASLGFSFTQPLLRNAGIDLERREILLARRAVDLTDAQLTQVTMDQLSIIEQAYWELAYAAANVSVQLGALTQARTQVASNERQVQAGTLAVIDVVEAQTQVATFEQDLANAQLALTQAENRLKSLILDDRSSPMWDRALVPSVPADRTLPALPVADAIRLALSNRPELAGLAAQETQNQVDQRFFRNQAKPRVDLVGTYTLAGLAGTLVTTGGSGGPNASDAALLARLNDLSARAGLEPLPIAPSTTSGTLPDFLEGSLGASLANVLQQRFPTVLVQLQVDLPIGNRTAQADSARAVIEGKAIAARRTQLEQAIEAEVRNALQQVRSAEQRMQSAGSAHRSAQEQYDSERRRFDAGLSTVFLVLQRQTALVAAQGQELRARADLNQAIAVFDRATGMTLTQHNVAFAGA